MRWFEYGTFLPTMRTHGTRVQRGLELRAAGRAHPREVPEAALHADALHLLAGLVHPPDRRAVHARAVHGLSRGRARVADIRDEYMFGPALLVAPVVEQGATTREVYLPAGTDWYNYWTNEKLHGGQTVTVKAPIDTIPLFVRAGSILPLGVPVESTHDKQAIAKVKVYPGANAEFTLYNDDGITYAYEKGDRQITTLRWNDRATAS